MIVCLICLYILFLSIQAESELRIAQSEFDRQYEITKLLLEGITSAHVSKGSVFYGGRGDPLK